MNLCSASVDVALAGRIGMRRGRRERRPPSSRPEPERARDHTPVHSSAHPRPLHTDRACIRLGRPRPPSTRRMPALLLLLPLPRAACPVESKMRPAAMSEVDKTHRFEKGVSAVTVTLVLSLLIDTDSPRLPALPFTLMRS